MKVHRQKYQKAQLTTRGPLMGIMIIRNSSSIQDLGLLIVQIYLARRDREFMPLEVYEQNFHLDSREVLLVDKEWDTE
ncbi:hypothetical protein Pyn_05896 [Prunus yedoensis var. nudiflora]|uniref:Uncharacterized protein n=1 Tax=Prunus yedoensis var. nudiflora TaxID=2094558 RepID=A0A314ZBG1_PRUYE|nr:hypothetical protein Pyn_05896 [Prunus yedoensis var. nudiflora]